MGLSSVRARPDLPTRGARRTLRPWTNTRERTSPAPLSFKFVGTALAGSLAMALVAAFAPLPAQIAVLGSCVSILAGLFVAYVEQEDVRERRRASCSSGSVSPWRSPRTTSSSTSTAPSPRR